MQNAALAELAQVEVEGVHIGDPTHQALRQVNVEVVAHKMPLARQRIRFDRPLGMGQEVGFGARGSTGRSNHLAAGHIEVEQKGRRPVPDVLELTAGDLAGRKR